MYNLTNGTAPGVSQPYWLLFVVVFLQCGVCRVFKYCQCYQIIQECITQQMTPSWSSLAHRRYCLLFGLFLEFRFGRKEGNILFNDALNTFF